MSDEPENLVLIYLRRIDLRLDRIEGELRDVKGRLGLLEAGQAGIRREIANLSESYASLSVRMDHFDERLSRIERRLDVIPA